MRRRIRPLSAQSQYTNNYLNPREQWNSETPSGQKKTAHPVDRERSGYETIESLMRGGGMRIQLSLMGGSDKFYLYTSKKLNPLLPPPLSPT